jgi:radical SAM superfamily enzyme YgiQ (UPF0313 family)
MTHGDDPTFLLYLADLTHTYVTVDAKQSPLAVGYIAASALARFPGRVSVELFKYPEDLDAALDRRLPDMIGFSNYMWSENLCLAFADEVKRRDPSVMVVMGGPNYPVDRGEQHAFMATRPCIDFYIDGEGETAFCEFLGTLLAHDFDHAACSKRLGTSPGVHFIDSGGFVANPPAARIKDLDEVVPSPYLSGLMDKFFDEHLSPMLQTSRGCPYSCTFCHDGLAYANKTYRFSDQRVVAELEYAAARSKVPAVTLADLNWGMFPRDVTIAREMKRIQQQYAWPNIVNTATAKSQKERVIEMSNILGDAMHVGASVQSTDDQVLKFIKRSNISRDAVSRMATESQKNATSSFTEIILCLPGDTRAKHFESAFSMMGAGIQDVNSYQFILLPGTEAANTESRGLHAYQTRFRVLPRCFGRYRILGRDTIVAEINEVCIGNSTMTHEDYVACRQFDLTLGIFNNGAILEELYRSVAFWGITRQEIIHVLHDRVPVTPGPLANLYRQCSLDENSNFWEDRDALMAFVTSKEGFLQYSSGELGRNQLMHWRAVGIFQHFPAVIAAAISAVEDILAARQRLDDTKREYLAALSKLVVAKKSDPTNVEFHEFAESHFDFVRLEALRYTIDPLTTASALKRSFCVAHPAPQKRMLESFFQQFGTDLRGLSHFIHRNPARLLYRQVGAE